MKILCWKDCVDSFSARKINPNTEQSNSLIKTAKGRIEYLKKQAITPESSNYIFEGYYSSIVEIIHAIALKKGYKINNHLCLGFLLKEKLKYKELFEIFDDLRFKRNALLYYGNPMNFEIAKDSIKKSKKLIKELLKITC